MRYANSVKSALTLAINSQTAKPIYINGTASSSSNYTLPAGSYLVYYDGTNYYFRTDGKITGDITGNAATVNGKTVAVNVPSDAKFTDTTYESKAAASGGTAVSLVTTGEKYTWNNKSSLALGETSSTAYRGDRGKAAYDHSQLTSGNPHGVTKSDVGLGSVGNFKAVSTVASQGLTDTEKSNARANIGAGTSSLAIGTTSTTAAAGNHTHTTTIAAGGTSTLNMSANTAYTLTAGGTSFIFKTPSDTNNKVTITNTNPTAATTYYPT
jgi:hypothetical protein